jgi:hypothetical protein
MAAGRERLIRSGPDRASHRVRHGIFRCRAIPGKGVVEG